LPLQEAQLNFWFNLALLQATQLSPAGPMLLARQAPDGAWQRANAEVKRQRLMLSRKFLGIRGGEATGEAGCVVRKRVWSGADEFLPSLPFVPLSPSTLLHTVFNI